MKSRSWNSIFDKEEYSKEYKKGNIFFEDLKDLSVYEDLPALAVTQSVSDLDISESCKLDKSKSNTSLKKRKFYNSMESFFGKSTTEHLLQKNIAIGFQILKVNHLKRSTSFEDLNIGVLERLDSTNEGLVNKFYTI